MNNELKPLPCPFCGCNEVGIYNYKGLNDSPYIAIHCFGCGVENKRCSPAYNSDVERWLVSLWNKRVSTDNTKTCLDKDLELFAKDSSISIIKAIEQGEKAGKFGGVYKITTSRLLPNCIPVFTKLLREHLEPLKYTITEVIEDRLFTLFQFGLLNESPKNVIPYINKIREQTQISYCANAMTYIEDMSAAIEEAAKEGKSRVIYKIAKINRLEHIFRKSIAQPILKKFTEAGYHIRAKLDEPHDATFYIDW